MVLVGVQCLGALGSGIRVYGFQYSCILKLWRILSINSKGPLRPKDVFGGRGPDLACIQHTPKRVLGVHLVHCL